ncbi:MAG: MATE family efflux transporter, partial [Firmicutes bacterium]|nr:MATE family efflux transporter [Bacillota bacterium]
MRITRHADRELILRGCLMRAMLSIAVPVVFGSFLQTLYNLTDTYWLGRIGTAPLAAINLVTPLQNVVTSFGSGLTVVSAVLTAQYIGAGKKQEASNLVSQIYACAIGFALLCAGLISVLAGALVSWLGAEGEVLRHGTAYLQVVILDMPLLFTNSIYQAVRQAQG